MIKLSIVCQLILITYNILAVHSLQDDCPIGKYRCKSKVKKCIDLNAICDGKRDCPEGEDETSSYCNEAAISKHYQKYNPGKAYVDEEDHYVKLKKKEIDRQVHPKNNTNNVTNEGDRYWPNNGCTAGHYLCNGTLNICIKILDVCNGIQDCPQNDDENQEVCEKRPKPDKITLDGMPAIVIEQGDSEVKDFDGTGFMFHVNNMIVYNSDVRMFNQNSDNNDK